MDAAALLRIEKNAGSVGVLREAQLIAGGDKQFTPREVGVALRPRLLLQRIGNIGRDGERPVAAAGPAAEAGVALPVRNDERVQRAYTCSAVSVLMPAACSALMPAGIFSVRMTTTAFLADFSTKA
jgi:hypothetical protein